MPYARKSSGTRSTSRSVYSKSATTSRAKATAAARTRSVRRGVPVPVRPAVKEYVKRQIDKAIPDRVITIQTDTDYNSVISAADVGYFFGQPDEPNSGGLAIPRRLALMADKPANSPLVDVLGRSLKAKSLTISGAFKLNPNVFFDSLGTVQNTEVIVSCYVLLDKESPYTVDQDRNCVNDLLLDERLMFPNVASSGCYNPGASQTAMIQDSGTEYDRQLRINRNRFKVLVRKDWKIIPRSVAAAEPLYVAGEASGPHTVLCAGDLVKRFKFRVPMPKKLKWDRKQWDNPCDTTQQAPFGYDPLIVWGYTPSSAPDVVFTNLNVKQWIKFRCEPQSM